jgi:hypothetical protein
MRVKYITFAVGVLLLVLATFQTLPIRGQSQKEARQEEVPAEGRLKIAARKAKAEGKKEIFIPAPISIPVSVHSLDEALSNSTVVTATLIGSKSYVLAPHKIGTWYKFKVSEYLSRRAALPAACRTCPAPPDAPAELYPVGEDEVLVLRHSGSLVIDGVKVNSVDGSLPPFSRGTSYLLFLDMNPAGKTGKLSLGAYGVFTVGRDGSVRHINNKSHPFKHEIEGDSPAIEHLRAKIKARQK